MVLGGVFEEIGPFDTGGILRKPKGCFWCGDIACTCEWKTDG